MLALIIIASLDTRKSNCGFYITYSTDLIICGGIFASVHDTTNSVFGLAIIGNIINNIKFTFTQPQSEISLLYFQKSYQSYVGLNNSLMGVEGFRFVNTSDRYSFL